MNEDLRAFVASVKGIASELEITPMEALGAYNVFLTEAHNNFHIREQIERDALQAEVMRSQIEMQGMAMSFHGAGDEKQAGD